MVPIGNNFILRFPDVPQLNPVLIRGGSQSPHSEAPTRLTAYRRLGGCITGFDRVSPKGAQICKVNTFNSLPISTRRPE